jgi:prepilin-type N-terminal cleavage/methylation domain-containing protein
MNASDHESAERRWSRRHRIRWRSARGMSLLELLTALSVAGIASGIVLASVEGDVSSAREAGAARAFAMRVRQTRLEAIQRSASVALQFVTTSSTPPRFHAYVDGNGNGVRTREIASGIDPPMGNATGLNEALAGVRFARASDVPAVGDDDDGSPPGLLSFAPTGSGTSGTVYLRGTTRQFAVRVYGPTGRVRLLEFDRHVRAWVER